MSPGKKAELKSFVEEHKLKITAIINTHCHIDHVLGNQFSKDTFNAPLLIPPGEEETYRAVKVYAPNYGFSCLY